MAQEKLLSFLRERIEEFRTEDFDDEYVSGLRDEALDKLSEFCTRAEEGKFTPLELANGEGAIFSVIEHKLRLIEKQYEDAADVLDTLLPPYPKELNPSNFDHPLDFIQEKIRYNIYERPDSFSEADFETSRTIERVQRRKSKVTQLIGELFTRIQYEALNIDYQGESEAETEQIYNKKAYFQNLKFKRYDEMSEEELKAHKEVCKKYGLNSIEGYGCTVAEVWALEKIMGPFKEFDKALGRTNGE